MALMVLQGNMATAHAARLARTEVIPAYPITPSTLFPEKISSFIADGEMKCQFIKCESEHSAMSACIGASAVGARTATATASQGLALMHELLFIAAGMRMPIVMAVANRTLSAPLNIWCDHQDSIAERDSGWIQLYGENNQEVLDLMLMAYKISEDHRVLLPSMVCLDAFMLTHTVENVEVPDINEVDEFLPPLKPKFAALDPERPMTQGAFVNPDYYMEFRENAHQSMAESYKVIDEVFAQFEKKFGRKRSRISGYKTEDAEIILVSMGSMTGTARFAVDQMRAKGEKVGLVKLTCFRPFPFKEVADLVKKAKIVAIAERNVSVGVCGAVYADFCAATANMEKKARIYDFIIGLGGRDILSSDFEKVIQSAKDAYKQNKEFHLEWINVKKGGR
jgi:pyruvate ferredoxin oxidoreductase alpha subunit